MPSSYYNSSGKEVFNGNTAENTDLNTINTAIDAGFEGVEADFDNLVVDLTFYVDMAQKWAEEAEDVEVAPGEFSSFHWAKKSEEDADAAAASASAASGSASAASASASSASSSASSASGSASSASSSASSASGSASTATTKAGISTTQAGVATTQATNASNSAIAAAASAVDAAASAVDAADELNNSVKLTGAQSVAGVKTFSSSPVVPTLTAGTNTTQVASSAFVVTAIAGKANLASPALTGNPTAPTQAEGNNSTRISTTAFVVTAISGKANLDSPTLLTPIASGGINATGAGYSRNGVQVVNLQQTGWGAPTGTATRTTFETETIALNLLARRVKALIDDLTLHGLIGA